MGEERSHVGWLQDFLPEQLVLSFFELEKITGDIRQCCPSTDKLPLSQLPIIHLIQVTIISCLVVLITFKLVFLVPPVPLFSLFWTLQPDWKKWKISQLRWFFCSKPHLAFFLAQSKTTKGPLACSDPLPLTPAPTFSPRIFHVTPRGPLCLLLYLPDLLLLLYLCTCCLHYLECASPRNVPVSFLTSFTSSDVTFSMRTSQAILSESATFISFPVSFFTLALIIM